MFALFSKEGQGDSPSGFLKIRKNPPIPLHKGGIHGSPILYLLCLIRKFAVTQSSLFKEGWGD